MSATVVSPAYSLVEPGLLQVTITIPTTVDGTSGSITNFTLPRAYAICLQAVSSNFNGKTLELKGAPDGTNFAALPTAKTLTSTGVFSVATADTTMLNYQVAFSGAPTVAVVVTILATQWR